MTPPNPPSARARRTNMLIFVACVAIWSTSWIAITTQVATTPPVTSLFWRFAVAFAALVVVERIRRKPGARRSVPLLASASVGVLYYFGGVALSYFALRYLSSAAIACLSVTVVFFSMAIKRVVHGTRIESSNVFGARVSTAGLALFFVDGDATSDLPVVGLVLGLASFLAIALGAAISEALQKRSGVTSLLINRNAIGCAALLYLGVALVTQTPLSVPLTLDYLGPLLYLAIICSAVVFVLFIELVGRLGAEYASYVTFLYPLIATYLSFAIGETQLRAPMIVGSLLVVAGSIIGLKYAKLTTLLAARGERSSA
jgi:drug/metabolite transporter (DMT)-like permease